jgi:hypothetical protein
MLAVEWIGCFGTKVFYVLVISLEELLCDGLGAVAMNTATARRIWHCSKQHLTVTECQLHMSPCNTILYLEHIAHCSYKNEHALADNRLALTCTGSVIQRFE